MNQLSENDSKKFYFEKKRKRGSTKNGAPMRLIFESMDLENDVDALVQGRVTKTKRSKSQSKKNKIFSAIYFWVDEFSFYGGREEWEVFSLSVCLFLSRG